MSQDKIDQVGDLMKKGATQGEVHASLGLLATNVKPPKFLRFCRDCYKAEAKECEPYWHRSHQLPGVIVCPYHNTLLIASDVDYTAENHKFGFVALSKIKVGHFSDYDIDDWWSEHLKYIAEQSTSILRSSCLTTKAITSYKEVLYERGYMTVGNRIRFNQLINDFRSFFTNGLLQQLNCEVTDTHDTWLHKLMRNPTEITHPLRHLLLLRFLETTTDSLLTQPCNSHFGNGPWPCLNKAADHYHLDVIEKCMISRCSKTGLPVGTFQCSCGFVYSRRGPDRVYEDKYRKGRIKEFGYVWNEKLTEANETNLSLRHKASLLGVDPGTIKNQTELLNNKEVLHNEGSNKEQSRQSERSFQTTTTPDEKCKVPTIKIKRVDWETRDEILLKSVMKAVNLIKSLPEPQRISVASIKRFTTTEYLSGKLTRNLSKLPKTRNYIEKCIDTTESFQIRRITWAANKLKETEGRVLGWRLLKTAGLNHPLKKSVYIKFVEITRQE